VTRERIARLERLPGWTWNPSTDAFEAKFAVLMAFVEREGHARVPVEHMEGGATKLGRWVHDRRTAYRRGELGEATIRRFEALPGWTWYPRTKHGGSKCPFAKGDGAGVTG
jgi:hypothetical protein